MFTLPPGDTYDKQCGEVFLTVNGNIIFHCTLCDMKYRGIREYAVHVIDKHFDPVIQEEDCMSTHSSDILEDEREENIEYDINVDENTDNDLCEQEDSNALQEEAIAFSEAKEPLLGVPVLTAISLANESETENEIKWEEITIEETKLNEAQTKKNKSLLKRPITKPTTSKPVASKLLKPLRRPLTESEKIRLANEAAKSLEAPAFKQPVPRGNIPDSERKHKCNFCGFAFRDRSNLIAHIKRHSDKRNFQCSYCSKMFCTRTEIDEHSRRHRNEKPFVCSYENCNKAYFSRSEVNMHYKRIHLNEKNHKCEICGQGFFEKSDVREHMVSHTQERNHECMVCNAKFLRRKSLLNHMKLHENKREYQCQLCSARFNQKPGLSSHMKNKHKDQ